MGDAPRGVGQGTSQWICAHNTIRSVGGSFALGNRTNQFIPDFEQSFVCVNNILDRFFVDDGSVIDAASVMDNNIHITDPGAVTDWGHAMNCPRRVREGER